MQLEKVKELELIQSKKQQEKLAQERKVREQAENFSKFCKENPEVPKKWGGRENSKWCKNNPDKLADRGKKHSQFLDK